jgi:Cu/Ag efflux pump CusA
MGNRLLVIVLALVAGLAGLHAVRNTPVDAIPDLTDTQVIVRAMFPGQAPQVVEDQVTYPLTTALMAVPGATPCAATRCSAMPSSTSCSRTAPTPTGRARGCWST